MSNAIRAATLAIVFALAGCAGTNPKDPFETYNRAMFRFNDALDQAALKPAAEQYEKLPSFVRTGVGNFFGNLGDVWTAVNNLLQGKIGDGMSDVMRVTFNTAFGFGGLLDWGSEAGLVKHKEDFGQTLGKWGVRSGPYFVLPLLGPSTVRDTLAWPIDIAGDPWDYVRPVAVRSSGYVVRIVDQRAAVLGASNLIEEAALDRYVFIRDAYLQRRESKIRDGASPETSYESEEESFGTAQNDDKAADKQLAGSAVAVKEAGSSAEPASKPVVELEQNAATSPQITEQVAEPATQNGNNGH
jgi:phospholipid-binding lipoprotein MlaA